MDFDQAIANLLAPHGDGQDRRVMRGAYPDGVVVEVRRYGGEPASGHTSPLSITIRLPGTVMTSTLFTGRAGVWTHLGAQGLPVQMGEWTVIETRRRR